MKISMKMLLSTVFVSAFSVGGVQTTIHAAQLPSHLVATPHEQRGIQVAEVDSPNDRDSGAKEDGDREANDVKTAPMTRTYSSNQGKQQVKHHRKYHHTRQKQTLLR